jgi:hypothetical protein
VVLNARLREHSGKIPLLDSSASLRSPYRQHSRYDLPTRRDDRGFGELITFEPGTVGPEAGSHSD